MIESNGLDILGVCHCDVHVFVLPLKQTVSVTWEINLPNPVNMIQRADLPGKVEPTISTSET